MSDNVAKTEGLLKETTKSAPTPQFSTSKLDIVRHKSSISLSSRV